MARYNRINLDGKSITETRTSAIDVLPGRASIITAGKFVVPAAKVVQKLYVANVAHLQGLGADEAVPAGDSIEGEYLETGREMAVLCKATAVIVKDSPLAVAATGIFDLAGTGDVVVAFAQEKITVGAAAQLVLVRGA